MKEHQDLFSKQSKIYQQKRPLYPNEFYAYLLSLIKNRELAWDCATGNGQAAVGLAPYFDKIIATDMSSEQLKFAYVHPKVDYKVLKSEDPLSVPEHSVDLVTVAQGIHWFDLNLFYKEVLRVLKPGGVIAIWGYSFHTSITPDIDQRLSSFYFETLGPYWKSNNKLLWDNYRTIAFPFHEVEVPKFKMEVKWTLIDLLDYFKTWSATQSFITAHQDDPTVSLLTQLEPYWGDPHSPKTLSWDLVVRVGIN